MKMFWWFLFVALYVIPLLLALLGFLNVSVQAKNILEAELTIEQRRQLKKKSGGWAGMGGILFVFVPLFNWLFAWVAWGQTTNLVNSTVEKVKESVV